MDYRIEKDTIGEVKVLKHVLWGPQTQRSINNFKIGKPSSMPIEIIHAFAILKKAAAFANFDLGVLTKTKKELISKVCDEIVNGDHDDQFPLVIWQTGSGTQTNMNINEVISNRAHQIEGKIIGEGNKILAPNDDVNMSQSSNDTFPTAMHIATYKKLITHTIPNLESFKTTLLEKSLEFEGVIKIGRTHLMDATPVTLGQEFSGYHSQIDHGLQSLNNSLSHLSELALGATAVGTGINSPKNYDTLSAEYISKFTGIEFISAKNKFESIASHDALVETHGALKLIANSLNKIANDIRLMASGPRSGIGEIIIPANEPGSSIMPGKVNPTQCEALCMVCAQVIGNDVTVTLGGMQGHYELNVFKPVIVSNVLESLTLISDSVKSFNDNCLKGIKANTKRITELLNNSLMLVTALNSKIGYYKSAEIANIAHENGLSLKEAALKTGYLTEDEFNAWVKPEDMIGR
ncbi:class II fumarate hydratase [Flavobacteriaceae bacterium]|nr:class II fumarate hydratase [Flavobacteriaceae bacterium]MDA9977850.1 class II fumarate hydratase [Flavobacteriaceae bacterium]MDB4023959.1 class II fumarate hydratase [Flavobacteriaceae bacterium]MDB4131251.1 class II fumarate hydratase [Flavobacteriaceae bacterium]MDC1460013.1 class II fumarate hydratase [Flavobacteriaceae bacterium]